MVIDKLGPASDTVGLGRPADEAVANVDGRFLTTLFVRDADLIAFPVGQQRQIDCCGEGAVCELGRRPKIDEGRAGGE